MRSKPTIKQRGQSWQVDYGRKTVNGKVSRVRKTYKTKAEAKAAIAARKIESQNNAVALTGIPDAQRMDILRAVKKLDGHGTLEQAVDFFLEHSARAGA
ncbi:MAG: Arm DNA-binding domain-containing protein, partial [Kiritimatiellia bacterium]|nr:Arm DNA-binding domain-containing protein [Kiritimatiellia bacterium]